MKRIALWLVSSTGAHPFGNEVARGPVQELIDENGAEVSVAFRTLDGEHSFLIEPDRVYHAASSNLATEHESAALTASISSVLYQGTQP